MWKLVLGGFFSSYFEAFEIWRAQKEVYSILMLRPFAEQRPNSETIASLLNSEVSFQLYAGRRLRSSRLFPTAAITDTETQITVWLLAETVRATISVLTTAYN